MRKAKISGIALMAGLTGLMIGTAPADSRPASLVYSAKIDGNTDLYLLTLDGTLIAFHGQFGNEVYLFVLDVDAGKLIQLEQRRGMHYYPQWSPDGQYLTYTSSDFDDVDFDIWSIRIDGTEDKPLVATPDDEPASSWVP